MKSSRHFKMLAKSNGARMLATVAALLLVLEPYAFALNQIVSKYPTGNVITSVNMGDSMTMEQGTVFGFNSAKSAADTDAYATIQEGACVTPATLHDFSEGKDGFITTGTGVTFSTVGTDGHLTSNGAAQTAYLRSTATRTYQWNRKFLWDCGTPTATGFVMSYSLPVWTNPNTGVTPNYFLAQIIKPDNSSVVVWATTNLPTTSGAVAWSQVTGSVPVNTFNQPGVYTLRVNGQFDGANTSSDLKIRFDDVNLTVTSNYASYKQDVEFTVRATPYSSLPSNQYKLDIRARKLAGDTESTYIEVYNGSTWDLVYTVNSGHTSWTTFDTHYLTTAQYNNGNVRVRYVDATPNGDSNRGGIDIEYQRVTVDQGTCVDQVQDIEADCGKCHNYNGDITKPWPNVGMHNKHAQSESISDCLWCHPDNGLDSAHKDGVVVIAGTKVWGTVAAGTSSGNANGAPATATYNGATGQCSNVACHMNLTTPAWTAAYVPSGFDGVNNIARNCSRCHNSGTAGADSAGNLNLNVAWPNTQDGGGHASHNAAVAFDEYSCQSNGSCHPDNRGQHSVVGDGNVIVKMAPNYGSPNTVIKWIRDVSTNKGAGTCSNVTCHGGQTTPKFNAASGNPINLTATNGTACILCHTNEQATGWGTLPGQASQYNSPISGLHRGGPPTSGQDHTDLTNKCQACHRNASLTKHFQFGGVTNLDSTAMDTVDSTYFWTTMGYGAGTGVAPNYTTPPTCSETMNGCHAETMTTIRNPATVWARKWSFDAYDTTTPVKQCYNCHGHWNTGAPNSGFVAGVVEPHVLSNSDTTLRNTLINNHTESGNDCATMCHGQGGTNYVHGVAIGSTTKDMSINANAGFVDNGTTVGCNMCHANETGVAPNGAGGNHVFADAGWLSATSVTGSTQVTCYNPGASAGCHGDGISQYWPDGSPNAYPNQLGRHTIHMQRLATKLGYTLPGTDAQQKAMCAYCHNDANGAGGSGHVDGAAPSSVGAFNHIGTGAVDGAPAGTYNSTAPGTCATVDCHNNKTTTSGTYGWYNGGTTACLMCHTLGGATNDPNSGLHGVVPTISGASGQHDDAFGTGGTCTSCHTTLPGPAGSTTHVNGTFTADGTVVANRTNMGLFATYAAVDATSNGTGTCSGAGVAGTGCHGGATYGVGDNGTWARKWNSSYANATNGNECKNCHGGLAGNADWNFGSATVNTGDTTVDHQGDYDGVGGSMMFGRHAASAQGTACNLCHVYADSPYTVGAFATYHRNGTIQVNSTMGMTVGSNNCTTNCHTNGGSHTVDASGWSKTTLAGPPLNCVTCHAAITQHIDADGTGPYTPTGGTFCLDCHTDHGVASRTGVSSANNIQIPTWSTTRLGGARIPSLNYGYTTATHNGFIQLGGTATASATYTNTVNATTEAQMCWGCHDKAGISEWGTNQHTTIGNSTYDFGDLYTANTGTTKTSNWSTGFWRSGRGRVATAGSGTNPYWYKRGAIQSTHSVNFDSGVAALTTTGNSLGFGRKESPDAVANIRCSYCHDVHGTHNGVNGDVSGGAGTNDQPYLRGTWRANNYAEDGAPTLGMANWSANGLFGTVPRANATTANTGITAVPRTGGWWIDQNSGNPTSAITGATALDKATNSSGLCEQCHGANKTGIWTAAALGTLDWATNSTGEANIWVSGYNGHANSVLGGGGRGAAASAESYARNIFTRTKRGTATASEASSGHGEVDMGLFTYTATRGYSYRGSMGYNWTPSAGSNTTAFRAFAWGTPTAGASGRSANSIWATGSQALTMAASPGTETANYDAQANYHTFTCAKCHNPHASRLPKLMITNCLDTNHNTWEDGTGFTGTNPGAPFASTRHSQWGSAQNCHRLDARASLTTGQSQALGTGWNRVTPWLEFTNPNATRTNITPSIPVP